MKNISLLEVTAFVLVATVSSITVQANAEPKDVDKEKPVMAKVEQAQDAVKADQLLAHDKLFAPLDIDSNGVISEQELSMTKNKLLKKQFSKIDSNADKGISEEELKSFLAKVDIKNNF